MFSRRTLLGWPAAGFLAAAAPPRASLANPADFASTWSEASHSAVRLIAGETVAGRLTAGLELRMQSGFKTYWRDPGDAGVPPAFDWAGSENLKDINVLWPAPHRFSDGGGWSIGYGGDIVLPIVATCADAAKPARLNLRINYAVCEKMCIPAQGAAALVVAPDGGSPHAARIADAMRKTPQRVGLKADRVDGLAFLSVALIDHAKAKLVVEAAAPGAADADLFVEGPKGSFFGKPKIELATAVDGRATIRILTPIEERAKNLKEWPLRLTLVAGDRAIETEAIIAAPQAT